MAQNEKKPENLNQTETKEETVGTLLRKTRLAANQDLRDIASYLCIRYQYLDALEEGRYKELPGEAYANGFIRSYASYLGLNPADIIARYKQEFFNLEKRENNLYVMSEEEAENVVPAPKVLIASLVLLLVAFGLWQSSSKEKDVPASVVVKPVDSITIVDQAYPLPEEKNVPAAVETEAVPAPQAVPPVPPVKPEYKEESKTETSEPAVQEPEPVKVEQKTEQKAEQKTEPEFLKPQVYGQKNHNPRLILIAKEKVWIEITRGNTVLFSRLLNRGDQYMVSSNKPEELFLKTGNAGGLEIYCDGKLTEALGPRGALRSNVALIPDDFAAKVVEDIE